MDKYIYLFLFIFIGTCRSDVFPNRKINLSSDKEDLKQVLQDVHNANKFEPEVFMNVSQLITSKGYPCEEYTVRTADGFLLGVQRIPHGRTSAPARGPIFLQHGLLAASSQWVINPANESLGFLLADLGYDVWLGNVRGNTYSSRHVKYKPSDAAFWAWSWDQMALLDLPAMIDLALNKSGHHTIHYVGHSQGTTIAFAMLSRLPAYAKKVTMFFAMGPVVTVGHIEGPLKYLGYLTPELKELFSIFGFHAFLPSSKFLHTLEDIFCNPEEKIVLELCKNIMFLICHIDAKEYNVTRLPVYLHHTPAGTSVQNIVHFGQMVRSDKFQMYDYGCPRENIKHYGQSIPPMYYPENVTTPVILFSGEDDRLADPEDVENLLQRLKTVYHSYQIPNWDHLDFLYAIDAAHVVYNKIINILAGL